MQQREIIHGTIDRFLFQSHDEQGFVIFVLIQGKDSIIVKGHLPQVHQGQEVELRGDWVFHKKFGKQFAAAECVTKVPTTVVGLQKYLGSGLIKGIGKVYAEKLIHRFGVDILTVIDTQPDRLQEVDGIGPKRVQMIVGAWKDQKSIADIMIFLQEKDISPAFAARIYKKYQHEAIAVLHENPYRLAEDIWGMGFRTADTIAQKLGFAVHAPQRIAAGITFALTQASGQGHLYRELEQLRQDTLELLALGVEHKELIKNGLYDLYNRQKIKLISEGDKHFIALIQHYGSEFGIAQRLHTLMGYPSKHSFNLDAMYAKLRAPKEGELLLNEDQQRAIMSCLNNKVSIITGGPGTGKTTLIKKLLSLLDEQKVNYKLAAPTGRAAQRIMEGTGRYAVTIHRLLEFDMSVMRFTFNENNALDLDILIIDEASMIDVFLAHAIIKALPHNARLLLIGDVDQLPSVGPGNFLNDCLASGVIPAVRLTQVFRQAQNSLIIVNAHRINKGEFPTSSLPDAKKDFIFIKEENPEQCIEHIKRVLFVELKKHQLTLDDAQILAPMNRGVVGTQMLNHQLQQLLNPEKGQSVAFAGTTFLRADKVMQLRNNYDKKVFNGDIGVIESIDQTERELTVNFNDRFVTYEFDELNEIVHAYAVTIHKSQGSEYPAVIIPVFMQHFMLLQRNLIYTGLTRAKKLCVIIGQSRALGMAIGNNKGIERVTFLQKFLNNKE